MTQCDPAILLTQLPEDRLRSSACFTTNIPINLLLSESSWRPHSFSVGGKLCFETFRKTFAILPFVGGKVQMVRSRKTFDVHGLREKYTFVTSYGKFFPQS